MSETQGKRVGLPTYINPKHPKSGPRSMLEGDTDKFDKGYDAIKWSKPPACPLCQHTESNLDCPIC